MASFDPDARTTRRFRRRPADTEPQPQDEPIRRPRFDRPPPAGNDWYGAPPDYAGPPPMEERPRYPWPPAAPERPFPPARPEPPVPPARPERGRLGLRRRRDRGGRRPRRRLLRRVVGVLAALAVVQGLLVLSLCWIDPPTTAFMLANPDGAIQHSVPVEHVSRNF